MPGEPSFGKDRDGAALLIMDQRTYRARETFLYVSESSPGKSHTVTVWSNGFASCTCRGWTVKKAGRERTCVHSARHSQPWAEERRLRDAMDATRERQDREDDERRERADRLQEAQRVRDHAEYLQRREANLNGMRADMAAQTERDAEYERGRREAQAARDARETHVEYQRGVRDAQAERAAAAEAHVAQVNRERAEAVAAQAAREAADAAMMCAEPGCYLGAVTDRRCYAHQAKPAPVTRAPKRRIYLD